jgi:hypothetical protein
MLECVHKTRLAALVRHLFTNVAHQTVLLSRHLQPQQQVCVAWTFAVVATWIYRVVLEAAAGYRLVHLTLLRLQLLHLERAKGVEGFEALGHGHRLFY